MRNVLTTSTRITATLAIGALLLAACGDDATEETTDAPPDEQAEEAAEQATQAADEPDEGGEPGATASWNGEDLGLDDLDCRDNASGVWLFAGGADGSDIEIQWESSEHLDTPVRVQLNFPADGADATIADGETYRADAAARDGIATGKAAVSGSLELAADEDTQADAAGGTLEIDASCVDALEL